MELDITLDREVAERLDLTKPVFLRYEDGGVSHQVAARIVRWVDIGQRIGVTFAVDGDHEFVSLIEDAWMDPMLSMMHSRDGQSTASGPSRLTPSPEGWSG